MKTTKIIKAKITLYNEQSEKFERELLFTDWQSIEKYISKYWKITKIHERSENFFIFTFKPGNKSGKWLKGYVHASKTVVIDYKTVG